MAEAFNTSEQSASAARQKPHRETYLDEVVDLICKQPEDHKPGELSGHELIKGGIKTASLFLGKKIGLGASAVSYALDQASRQDSAGEQAADLTLGAVKGTALAKTFNWLGAKDFNIAGKGLALGTTSRLIENGLSRETFLNSQTGDYDAMFGLKKTFTQSVNFRAAAGDIAVFGTSHLLLKGIDGAGLANLRNSRLAGTMLTGSAFGLSSGTYQEIMRQKDAGESLDLGKILKSGFAHGLVDGVAAGPGGIRAALTRAPELSYHEATKPYRQRLVEPEKSDYMIETPVKNARNFTSMEDFQARGIERLSTPSRIYKVTEHDGRLVVPETFAARLDRIRSLRDAAAQNLGEVGGIGKKFGVLNARLKLDFDPYRMNALPEEVVAAMDKAPDRRFFKDIRLESKSPYEQWHREKYKKSENVEGELYKDGNMSLFGTKTGRNAELYLQHEWTHIAEKFNPATRSAFDLAAKMEGKYEDDAYMFRDYADVNSSENWAVHYGEVFLGGSKAQFERMARNAPMRTAVLSRSLNEILSQVPEGQRSSIQPELAERIKFVDHTVIPEVKQWLDRLTNPDAVELRNYLFGEKASR